MGVFGERVPEGGGSYCMEKALSPKVLKFWVRKLPSELQRLREGVSHRGAGYAGLCDTQTQKSIFGSVHGEQRQVCNKKGPSQNCCHKIESTL